MLGCPDVCGTCDLLKAPIFAKLSRNGRRRLPGYSRPKVLQPGQPLFEKGEPTKDYFFVRRGLVEVKVIRNTENEIGISLAFPGDFLGFGSILQTVYEYTATALTPVWACAVKVPQLRNLLKAEIDFRRELETRTVGTLFDRHVMGDISQRRLTQKLAELIIQVDTVLRAMPIERGNAPRFPLSSQKIADIVGAPSPEVLRALETMAQDGAMIMDGPRLKIGNRARLRAYAPGVQTTSTLAQLPTSGPALYGGRGPAKTPEIGGLKKK